MNKLNKLNKLNKVFSLVIVLGMMLALVACGGKEAKTPDEVKGKTYDTGKFTVLVPDGWLAVPAKDMFNNYDGDNDPTTVYICKGAKNEMDMLNTPYITLLYHEDGVASTDMRDFYEDAKDIDAITTGDYTWEGYEAKSSGVPVVILNTKKPNVFDVNLNVEMDGKKISVKDADVQAILASLKAK